MWFLVLGWMAGCGLPKCEALCATQADCVQGEVDAFGSSWPDWTGFDDRQAFEDGCASVFEQSQEGGAPRGELQDTCQTALEQDPCPSASD